MRNLIVYIVFNLYRFFLQANDCVVNMQNIETMIDFKNKVCFIRQRSFTNIIFHDKERLLIELLPPLKRNYGKRK